MVTLNIIDQHSSSDDDDCNATLTVVLGLVWLELPDAVWCTLV